MLIPSTSERPKSLLVVVPDLFTWLGASIIFLGVLIISYREMKLDKEIIRKRLNIKS